MQNTNGPYPGSSRFLLGMVVKAGWSGLNSVTASWFWEFFSEARPKA